MQQDRGGHDRTIRKAEQHGRPFQEPGLQRLLQKIREVVCLVEEIGIIKCAVRVSPEKGEAFLPCDRTSQRQIRTIRADPVGERDEIAFMHATAMQQHQRRRIMFGSCRKAEKILMLRHGVIRVNGADRHRSDSRRGYYSAVPLSVVLSRA
ncbi:hypothetical protein FHS26_002690 [Rhizobium pisi]|uniref:Uncharacterized protein n=1 Tax=Rhizobium pisi TaxID=574561 RepID=A0A7W5BL77_9HYPH|nr:hypothetical protein [Rhizobium pisi]MBB3134952.1 hypothetical protein [Rhizobium pisi]